MIIVIKVLEKLGGIELLSQWLSPVMSLVGLPSEMGLVWATTLVTNMYAGLVIFMSIDTNLTVAQVSILGTLMLLAHSLSIEVAVAKQAGVGIVMTLIIRIGGLLINEAKRGHISPRDIFVAMMLLNLLHSLIENALLILLIGADFMTIFGDALYLQWL
ncbi:hypothetical protein [Nitrincola nitratireducens]|uniref:Nucleoside recognition n=1 Tax=Nitrincola nitratireducens TaxID=1229521 RepID=W9UW21_9GAMM|nr:hypothetical protein [Nitrincola nitratireducens]EXJ11433.1 Nucleoside recognition [Nitrincola nitratireducens]